MSEMADILDKLGSTFNLHTLANQGKIWQDGLQLVMSEARTIYAISYLGGPAGSMEGGRQAEIAKSILGSMNVPYIVAAPLLIQACPASQSQHFFVRAIVSVP